MAEFDTPYTTPDEDPFSVQPIVGLVKPIRVVSHRRSSLLDKWILEQQTQSPTASHEDGSLSAPWCNEGSLTSSSNPYLAYPDLPRLSSKEPEANEAETASIVSYDLVEDDDIPLDIPSEEPPSLAPSTPVSQHIHKSSRHSVTPTFRNLSFLSGTPAGSSSNMEAASRALARLSFFPRAPRSSAGPSSEMMGSQQHNRSSSLSTLNSSPRQQTAKEILPTASFKWRPSVLGHFQQVSASQVSVETSEALNSPSRPSISSGETYTTWNTSHTTTTLDTHIPSTPSKLSLFDSIRLRSSKSPKAISRLSVASGSSIQLSDLQRDEITKESTDHAKCSASKRVPFKPMSSALLDNLDSDDNLDLPHIHRPNKYESNGFAIPHSSGSLPRVKFASLNSRSHRKKKKLIISGIGVTEVRKFENLKRWCESFGDIRQITRMPNGDLQIDFRDPEVADTVCRVRAKVFIAGVGSVQLSYISGNKR